MNPKQKVVIILGMVLLVVMGLVPPWKYTVHMEPWYSNEQPAGYAPLFWPPVPIRAVERGLDAKMQPRFGVRVDRDRLGIQWGVVLFLTIGGTLLLIERKNARVLIAQARERTFFELASEDEALGVKPAPGPSPSGPSNAAKAARATARGTAAGDSAPGSAEVLTEDEL